ncbi:MAG: hypothetical protein HON76_09425 [Candidatus Scalindua sp.]|jgi:hypothetical protein|nr:hypothetical protein [Candidatus Scalindua sp.]MBT5305304.1 hypothetical protein [Candidatus Scalindua sp.]MBT6053075.1 hypothetical protein [Candidatus Scalindua sp.]MBT6230564.1 hypothetical protein [Candidatus Scalindua sp.]MBT6562735.1 hypothetical protein [Candidatus Scalindua sp.]
MEPEKLMDGISKEMNIALKAMGKAKTSEEKLVYSKIVNNLSQSLGVFLSLVSDMGLFDDDGEPIPF